VLVLGMLEGAVGDKVRYAIMEYGLHRAKSGHTRLKMCKGIHKRVIMA